MNRIFPILLVFFFGAYVLYVFATIDYIAGNAVARPDMFTPVRLSSVACVLLVAYVVWRLRHEPLFQIQSFLIAAACGGMWLLVFSGGKFPFNVALIYGILSGLFGGSIENRWMAAGVGFLAFLAQVFIDLFGFFFILGYKGFH